MKRHGSTVGALLIAVVMLGTGVLAFAGENERRSTIPAGTVIDVRVIDNLTSEKAQAGDVFHGTLEQPLYANGRELYPKGADVTGRVIDSHPSGRLSDPGTLSLEITEITYSGRKTRVHVTPFDIKGESHTKSNVTKIGGGAALGAVIGAIAGGGKGAAIGAGVGGAAGTGVAAASGKKEAIVESEAVLSFTVAESFQESVVAPVTPARETGQASLQPCDTGLRQFSLRDQRVIRNCVSAMASSLPRSVTTRSDMPADNQLQTGTILTPGLQKRVQPLPADCESQLAPLPRDLERVVYSRRVLLLDANSRIIDSFDLDALQ